MLAIVLVIGTTNRRRFRLCIPAGGSTLLGVVCALESLLLLLVIFHLSPSPPASDSKSKCLVSACPPAWEKLQLLRHAEKDKWFVYLPLPLLCFSLAWLGKINIYFWAYLRESRKTSALGVYSSPSPAQPWEAERSPFRRFKELKPSCLLLFHLLH